MARDDRGRLIAALIARLGNFQLAEEALQDAMVSAVTHWGRNGLPHSPQGWLLQVAYRKAIDRVRQNKSETPQGGRTAPADRRGDGRRTPTTSPTIACA